MYGVLIVDDEESVRSGLRDCVNWSRYGVRVVGEAEDGEEALALLAETPAQIVVTDVKMPHMDGITLSAKLRERYPDIRIVFISGFDDLDYIKSALKLEAVDYILKPLQLDELEAVIAKIADRLRAEETRLAKLNELHMKLNQSIPLLRERFLVALVRDGVKEAGRMTDKFGFLGIRLRPGEGQYCVFIVAIDDYADSAAGLTESDRQLTSFALLNICEDIMNERLLGHAFEIRPGEYAGILNLFSDAEEEELFPVVNECRTQLNRILKLDVTIGVGRTVGELASLPHSYRQAAAAAEHKWYLGKNQIITIDSLESGTEGQVADAMPDIRRFVSLLKAERPLDATGYIERWFGALQGSRALPIKTCRNGCAQLLLACSNLLLELELEPEAVGRSERSLWDLMQRVETIGEMQEALLAHTRLVHAAIAEKRERKTRNVVVQIQKYMQEHYARDLTIAEIAGSVYLTTTYVCLLFKQETGMTINEYLIDVRIGRAKQMLADPRNKLYDICFAVGYKDPSYFSKLFKKQTGYAPTEYRDKIL